MKTATPVLLLLLLLFCITTFAQPAAIGDLRDGGVVFWVDPLDNRHGLVCALSDYPSSEAKEAWGCLRTDLPSVPNAIAKSPKQPTGPGADLGDGMSNTNGILIDCPTAPAALAARSYGPEWFLPSAKELKEMYVNKATLEEAPGFTPFQSDFYWSSTEYDTHRAWKQLFYASGFQVPWFKDSSYFVRAVRAF